MHQLAGVLLSVLAITGGLVTGESSGLYQPLASAGHLWESPQDQSAVNLFAASLTKYYVGFARRGSNWTAEMDEVTKKNRAYLAEQVTAQKLVGAGQVMDGEDLRWILFFKGESMDEAKAIVEAAPAIQANRFTGEIRQMWGTRGVGAKLAEAAKAGKMPSGPKATHYLAVFKKGPKWSAEESESTRKMLQDQITNMWKLHEQGSLKFYGVFDDAGDIRGFVVLQAKSLKDAQKLLKKDPAIKAGWSTTEYYTFEVAEGVLP